MLQPGTKVRIKSYEEIERTLNEDSMCDNILFSPHMERYCNNTYVIKRKSPILENAYELHDVRSLFVSKWFDIIEEPLTDCWNDGSEEQRSLCLALIRQTLVGNAPDLSILEKSDTKAFPITACGGFDYADFPNDHWCYTRKIAKNIPDWPCLKLKPEILEEAIKNCLLQHGLQYFKEYVHFNINSWFVFNDTEKDDFWYEVSKKLYSYSGAIKKTDIEQPIKTQENEIKFQRKKGCVLRGTVPEGNQQSSGKCKTATCSGHLSNQICSGR